MERRAPPVPSIFRRIASLHPWPFDLQKVITIPATPQDLLYDHPSTNRNQQSLTMSHRVLEQAHPVTTQSTSKQKGQLHRGMALALISQNQPLGVLDRQESTGQTAHLLPSLISIYSPQSRKQLAIALETASSL